MEKKWLRECLSKAYGWYKENRVIVCSLFYFRNQVHQIYCEVVDGTDYILCEKAEELLATESVNAKRLCGFKELGENGRKICQGTTKYSHEELKARAVFLGIQYCLFFCALYPMFQEFRCYVISMFPPMVNKALL